ncbi:CRE-PAS-6 protein [Caenorhabditis remanei]|uniref:Proteasome subunit alpha type n=1 Tax=Caenorhabditis remanei TaxID=31234 RepID=E3LUB3_CAERE|nr:CRE-PAS-6 protein [Caenorhabditis remanei]
MFRNQYDSDVTVWSPQGRLHQVEYAVEAMKQGSATVGIKSDTHAVIVALKRAQNELSSHQKKIYEIDVHAGVSIAGLLSDGRILARFLQTECSSWRWDYKQPVPIKKLAEAMQLKLQANTQYYGRRPFGVGILIAGYDKDGAHIIQTDPSAEVVSMHGTSIGARSQSARTYLERNVDKFEKCKTSCLISVFHLFILASPEELIVHALLALRDTLPAEENLSAQNTSIGIVGKDSPFSLLEDAQVSVHLNSVSTHPRTTAQAQGGGAEPMQM